MTRSVLLVSNGHGEDTVGALLARRLISAGISVTAYPLVGTGEAYGDIPLLDPRRALPSGGFSLRGSWGQLVADVRSGLVAHWRAQRRTLAAQRRTHALAVAIGDVYCLSMAARAAKRLMFVATAKSEHNEPHQSVERRAMRKAEAIWTRDEVTATALSRYHLPARFAGNPLMDAIPAPERALPLPPGVPVILLLPGSRADALANVMTLLKVVLQVSATEGGIFACALPPSLKVLDVVRGAAATKRWEVAGEFLQSAHTKVLVTRDFGAALEAATIVVGLAGTANEQAAGLGKPVVAFPLDGGVQFTSRFLDLQKKLLGDALITALNWEDAAKAVAHLIQNPEERRVRGEAGRQRMGPPGAVAAIAKAILQSTDTRTR